MDLQSGSGGLFLDLGHLGRFENYSENEIVNRIEYHSILYVFFGKISSIDAISNLCIKLAFEWTWFVGRNDIDFFEDFSIHTPLQSLLFDVIARFTDIVATKSTRTGSGKWINFDTRHLISNIFLFHK